MAGSEGAGPEDHASATKVDRGYRSASNAPAAQPTAEEARLALARKQLAAVISVESDQRIAEVDDLKFLNGDQWDAAIKAQRMQEQRPCLTVNQLSQFVKQVQNDQRQNRPRIEVEPGSADADPETAKTVGGLIRDIEYLSNADAAYDTGFEGGARAGRGYWRVVSKFCDPRSFNQELRIERIRNALSVYRDNLVKEADGSDANFCFVSELVREEDHAERWPGKPMVSLDDVKGNTELGNWREGDYIRVADYYFRTREIKTLQLWKLGTETKALFEDEAVKAAAALKDWTRMLKPGTEEPMERKSEVIKVHLWKINGMCALEKTVWPGTIIPVIPCYGDEIDIEGKVTYKGVIRDAKSPQEMYNYWLTASTEQIALLPKAPYIGAEGQFSGHEQKWRTANRISHPFLEYKPKTIGGQLVPAPVRQPFGEVPAGIMQMTVNAREDLRASTGMYRPADQAGPERSGKAIRAEMEKGDVITFSYKDNLTRALQYTGRVIVEVLPYFYDTERDVSVTDESGKRKTVKVNTQKDGEPYLMLGKGKYDVKVRVGPSYQSKRHEARTWMVEFMAVVPSAAPLIADLIARNSDIENADQIADRLFAMLPPNIQALSNDEVLGEVPEDVKPVVMKLVAQLQGMGAEVQRYQQALQVAAKQLDDKEAILATQRYNADAAAASKEAVAAINGAVALTKESMAQESANVAKMLEKVQVLADGIGQASTYLEDLYKRGAQMSADASKGQQKALDGPLPDPALTEGAGGAAGAAKDVAAAQV
jgi:hypothetical protein